MCEGCSSKLHSIVECERMHFYPKLTEIIHERNITEQNRSKHKRISNRNCRASEPKGLSIRYTAKARG